MAFLGTIGFSIFFTVKKSRIWTVGVGGALVWAVFLGVNTVFGNEMTALLTASAIASVLAEILARIVKTPGTVLLMPMLIPLIPGGNLYYTMFNMVKGNTEAFQSYLQLVLKEAASIAVGIMLIASAVQVINKIKRYQSNQRLPGVKL